tara:strand:+ start:427 stop:834 length:408 start_codon:yes stop_codon:yes gene_type:complete
VGGEQCLGSPAIEGEDLEAIDGWGAWLDRRGWMVLRPGHGGLTRRHLASGASQTIDRTIDAWEKRHGASTIKNSIAPLVRVLDEAVRDGLIPINPAKNRAKRSLNRNAFRLQPSEEASPRSHAIPDMGTLTKLAE